MISCIVSAYELSHMQQYVSLSMFTDAVGNWLPPLRHTQHYWWYT